MKIFILETLLLLNLLLYIVVIIYGPNSHFIIPD